MDFVQKATRLLQGFRGEDYVFGLDVLSSVGELAARFGPKTLLISSQSSWIEPLVNDMITTLAQNQVEVVGGKQWPGAQPNTPTADVYRIESYILHMKPDSIIAFGSGSTIDAVKAANVLATLGAEQPNIDHYFGTGIVSETLKRTGKKLLPTIAVQTAASSGAHLTKYSNVTDLAQGQKKLIVDEAIIPTKAVFDYGITTSMPLGLTLDGALDGMAHCLEVFYGAKPENYELLQGITETALELIIGNAHTIIKDKSNLEGRQALGLATDLGGYAIMIGGTNGAHLTSFSLIDVTSHGRACGIMNPYYTVFFAPAIEKQLRLVGGIFQKHGYLKADLDALTGRELGIAVAQAMIDFARSINSPTNLKGLPGFTDDHIKRALTAAKDPQLDMKLKNMPIPLDASLVDEYMKPILLAAVQEDFSLIKNMPENVD